MGGLYKEKEECCGCSACYNSCPVAAITMIADEEGFLYPLIDQRNCIDCGRCVAVCPLKKTGNYKNIQFPKFYAARHTDTVVLDKSTSGGAFTAISDVILHEGGVVYGADFDNQFRVFHCRAVTTEQRDRLRISKYVQSDMGRVYQQIKADLQTGCKVLFTGTPCQCAGLRGFLGESPLSEQLYVCDLICHSIPSPLVWEDYKKLLEKEQSGRLASVQFRSKVYGWSRDSGGKGFRFTIASKEGVFEDDRFYRMFFSFGTITRPSCSRCPFTDVHRPSDLTIADYWGIEKYCPQWYDPRGVSLLLENTDKGTALLTKCQADLFMDERLPEEELKEQPRLRKAVRVHPERAAFWEEYRRFGLAHILEKSEKMEK